MGWPLGWESLDPLPYFDAWLTATLDGSWWLAEPSDVPRVARGVKKRVARLRALGNGQVPLCAAVAWSMLVEEFFREEVK